ncbi:MAG: type II secretion system protein GspG [Sumerlaeia bacterium]
MNSSPAKSPAFTLIELLVTVAIIAILAAIAIPNLLQAQVRSKVSRAKADLRTVVTALETYRVDNNQYPTYHYDGTALAFHIGGQVTGFGASPPFNGPNPITSPISYITQMPQDPFLAERGGDRKETEYLYVNWDYALARAVDSANRFAQFSQMRRVYGPYRLHSRGPDGEGPDSGMPYDPTNGTVSPGDITYGPNAGYDKLAPLP